MTSIPNDERRAVTVEQMAEQVARVLGISCGHACELERCGELPGVIRLSLRFIVSCAITRRAVAGDRGGSLPMFDTDNPEEARRYIRLLAA